MADSGAVRMKHEMEIHVHLHFDSPVTINVVHPQPPPRRAVKATLHTEELNGMAGVITVDTGGKVKLTFDDDKGDTDALAPDGAVITYTSDNEAVATVSSDPVNPLEGDVSGVTEGSANIGATITNPDGSSVLEPDGITPFTVASVSVTVGAGLAVSATLEQE